jgi:hypothetical protein
MSDEREVEWPEPRPDPEEEPAEPWANADQESEHKSIREIWDRLRGDHGKSEP